MAKFVRYPYRHNGDNKGSRRRTPCRQKLQVRSREGEHSLYLRIKECWVWKSQWKSTMSARAREEEKGARSWTKDILFQWLFTERRRSRRRSISRFSFRNPPRFVSLRDPFSSSSSLALFPSLTFTIEPHLRLHRESSSFPLPPSSRLALCNEKCARNRYFLPRASLLLLLCIQRLKKKLREKFRGRISQDGKPLFKYELESDLVFNSSN